MRSWTLLVVFYFPAFQESFVRQGTCRKDTGRDWRRHGPKVMPNVDPVRWWATRCHSLASESVQKGGAPTIWREVWEWLKMANTKSSSNHMQKGLYYHVAGETHYVIRRLSKQNLPQQLHWSSESCVFLHMSHFAQTHPVKNSTRPVRPGFCFESRKPKMQAVPSNQSLKCSIQGHNEKLRGIGPKWYVRPSQRLHNLYCLPSELGNYITA